MQLLSSDDTRWQTDASAEGPRAGLLATLAQWRAWRPRWPQALPVALVLDNTDDVTELAADLSRLAVLVLQFPKWTDGRAYSQARLLRGRLGFAGELQAAGDVVVDMAPLLARTGFSSARLRNGQSLQAAQRALGFFDGHYQADTIEPRPEFLRRAA